MRSLSEQLLDPNCPWTSWKLLRIPHIKWCEEQVCSWIQEPANTWSNLAYILVAIALHRSMRNLKSASLRFFSTAALCVGVTSFAWHASNVFFLQVLDFSGMYIFAGTVILINLERLKIRKFSFTLFWCLVIFLTCFTVAVDGTRFPIQLIVFVLILSIVFTEIIALRTLQAPRSLLWFGLTIALLFLAATFSGADHRRLFCDPQNHWIQGHAIWHVLSALSMFAAAFHYRQFDEVLANPPVELDPPNDLKNS